MQVYALNELHERDRMNRLRHRVLLLALVDERRRRRERENRRKPRSCWQREWIARRTDFGMYTLYRVLKGPLNLK